MRSKLTSCLGRCWAKALRVRLKRRRRCPRGDSGSSGDGVHRAKYGNAPYATWDVVFKTQSPTEMDTFEDDNPFENDIERVPSETSSTSKVNISAPSSPPPNPARLLSPHKPFPSPPAQRQPQQTYKSDFCCYRDRWLHSGDDAEVLVRPHSHCSSYSSLMSAHDKITDAQKTTLHSSTPYITYVIHAGVSISRGIASRPSDADSHMNRLRKPDIGIPSSSLCA